MKLSLPIFGLMLMIGCGALAQVTVELELEQRQFLPSETLPVAVRLTNRSGQPLRLGDDPKWLTFSVTADDNFVVTRTGDAPVEGEFVVGSSQVATKRVDLAPCFQLTRHGGYRVVARVQIKEWHAEFVSEPQSFDIIDGAKLWSITFGLPAPDGVTNSAPEVRRYTLEEANYLRSQLRMYVQVSDESERQIFKVRAIGPMVSFSQPEARLDPRNRLHVIYQSGARVFTYSVINPDCDIVWQENYDYLKTRPRLQVDDAGNISVLGGVRRLKPSDVPSVQSPGAKPAPPPVQKP
jgi:hypothetical protein